MRRSGRVGAWLYGLAWVLFLLAQYRVFVHLTLYLSQPQPGIWYYISSDTLVFDAVYQDLFVDGFHWAGWHVSHSPQFVEKLWYFALRFAAGGALPAHLLHALLVPTLVAVSFQLILRSLSPDAPPRELAIMLLAAGVLPLLYVQGIALGPDRVFLGGPPRQLPLDGPRLSGPGAASAETAVEWPSWAEASRSRRCSASASFDWSRLEARWKPR